jgi:glutamine synthetase
MSDSNYIKIYTGSFIIVQRMVNTLEKVGINAVVKDETESGLISMFGATNPNLQQIYVHKDELDKATPLIEDIITELKN